VHNEGIAIASLTLPGEKSMNQPPYGPPGAALGYAPSSTHQGGARSTSQAQKGFFAGLFDLSFTTFVTTRVLKVLYVFYLVAVGCALLGGVGTGLLTVVAGGANDSGGAAVLGVVQIIVAPFACIFALIYGRILFECVAVFFRVAEHLSEINRKTRD
jgi:hypothetical protein